MDYFRGDASYYSEMPSLYVLLLLASFRLLSVFVVRSWFVPDEVYQSSEIAHSIVFSTGHLSWEWSAALRSVLHPAIIAALYSTLSFLGLDTQSWIYLAPRIQHALMFSLGDFAYLSLADRLLPTSVGAHYAKSTYLSCWFVFYCGSRTLSNSLETALTLLALQWFPWEGCNYRGKVWPYMAIGFLTIVIRPTAALIWLVLGIHHLIFSKTPLKLIFSTVLPMCILVMGISLGLDSLFYGRLTSTAWNFLMFNVVTGGSAHFGTHPWHWLWTQGLPSVLTLQCLPILLGIFTPLRPALLPLITAVFYILFHSALPHKEQRFLLPVIPLLCLYGGSFFADRRHHKLKTYFYWFMITANVAVAVYTGLIHQRGPYAAAHAVLEKNHGDEKPNLLLLMPCYSLPGYSFFHDTISGIKQLDCSPDIEGNGKEDEADVFYNNPLEWIHRNQLDNFNKIIMYEKMYITLAEELRKRNFTLCDKVFHAHFLTSDRQDHFIVILCK